MSRVTTAAVLRGHDQPHVLEEVTLSDLAPHEILVRVVGAGMCHSDMMPRIEALSKALGPAILGHEGAGVVEEVGSAVVRLRPGDHVLLSFDSCGICANCLRAAPAYCLQFNAYNLSGRRRDGSAGAAADDGSPIAARFFGQSSFAHHAIATERNAVVIDPSLPLELLGPLGCGLQTGAGSVLNEMRLAPGQSLAVFGAGAVGLAAVMAAKIAGAREIVAVDLHDSRLEMARELGATRVVRGDEPDLVAAVRGDGPGLDFSFETTAVTPVITAAISVLAVPGKAVLVGAGGELAVTPGALIGRTVTYALEGSSIPQVFLPQLIDYWQRGLFPFEKFVRQYPMSEINQAEADSLSGATIKPVLIP
ncbi:NAD(P)-dependent alcohol dehydrogenase [Streptomyces sp. CA-100214]